MFIRNLRRSLRIKKPDFGFIKNKFSKISVNKKLLIITGVTCVVVILGGKSFRWFFPVIVGVRPISRFEIWSRLEKTAGKQVVEDIINETILNQALNKEGIRINDKKVSDAVARMEKQLKPGTITHEALVKQFRNQEIIEELLGDNISVSTEEMKNYFTEKEKSSYKNKDFLSVKEEIENILRQQKLQTAFDKWFAEAKDRAIISNSGL